MMSTIYILSIITWTSPFILLMVFGLLLGISLFRNVFFGINSSKTSSLTKLQKGTLFSACFSFLSISIFAISHSIVKIYTINKYCNYKTQNDLLKVQLQYSLNSAMQYRTSIGIFWWIEIISNIIWILSMYLHILLRLISTFKDSKYAISKQIIYIYIIIPLFNVFMSIISLILYRNLVISFTISQILQILSCLPSLFCGCHLIYQFNTKLFKLVLEREKELSSSSCGDEYIFNDEQIHKLSIATKHTILGNFIAISSLLFTFYWISIICIATFFGANILNLWFRAMVDLIRVFVTCLISFPLFLAFTVNKKYYLCCCGYCDNKLKKIYGNMAMRKLKDKYAGYHYIKKHNISSELTVELTDTTTTIRK